MSKLFDAQVDAEDDVYLNLRDTSSNRDAKEFIEEMWCIYETYADPTFRKGITISFLERYWEMYLTWGLINTHYSVSSANEGPDVCVALDSGNVWLEAVTPKAGIGKNEVKHFESKGEQFAFGAHPEEKILQRICGAINTKHRVYKGYVEKGTISGDEPYIIAINGCQIPYACIKDELPIVVSAVFSFGNLQATIDTKTLEVLHSSYEYRPEVINANGSPVETDIFLDENYSGLSAILFSCSDPLNRRGGYGDDFIIIHNSKAANPLPRGSFKFGREYWVEDKGEEMSLEHKVWVSKSKGII